MKNLLISVSVLSLFLSACATNSTKSVMKPVAQEDQALVEINGTEGLASTGPSTSVVASVHESAIEHDTCMLVDLVFSNQKERSIEIDPASFTARNDAQRSYEILSATEYVSELNEIYRSKLQESTGSQSNMGSFVDSSAYTGASNISSAGDSSYARNSSRNQALEARMNRYADAYLTTTSLPANQSVKGRICLVVPENDESLTGLTISIPVESEIHQFKFSLMTE